MTASEFTKIVRAGADKLRVDEIVLATAEGTLHGKGMLRISRERLELDLTLDRGESLPPPQSGIYTVSQFWSLEGLIEDHLEFRCENIPPGGAYRIRNDRTTMTFSLNPIWLEWPNHSEESAALREAVFAKYAKAVEPREAGNVHDGAKESEEEGVSPYAAVKFEALLADYPFLYDEKPHKIEIDEDSPFAKCGNPRPSFGGKIEGFRYKLLREGADVRLTLEADKSYKTAGAEADQDLFQCFLRALAFLFGTHAWPYRIRYWQGSRKVSERITAARRLPRTAHTPFTESMVALAAFGGHEFNLLDAISKAASFFMSECELVKEVAELLSIFRAADDQGVKSEITLLAMCTLFENLVNLLFRHLTLETTLLETNPEMKSFVDAKKELVECIESQAFAKEDGYARLLSVLKSASPLNQREKFKAVALHLGLPWEGDMEEIFKTWKKARNPLVHESRRADLPESGIREALLSESRIAGCINILLLKAMGYSGRVRTSAFEDKFRQI